METKFRIRETPNYWLAVSEEEIKVGDYVTDTFTIRTFDDTFSLLGKKKVIAYKPKGGAPKLELPLLPEMVIEDDIENLANEAVKKQLVRILLGESKDEVLDDIQKRKHYFKEGYKAATKVYSEGDLINLLHFTIDKKGGLDSKEFRESSYEKIVNRFIQSLKQPKTPKWFVAKYKTEYTADGLDYQSDGLKTTTINGKEYLVGTYLNE
jgi:hypothetical protein